MYGHLSFTKFLIYKTNLLWQRLLQSISDYNRIVFITYFVADFFQFPDILVIPFFILLYFRNKYSKCISIS